MNSLAWLKNAARRAWTPSEALLLFLLLTVAPLTANLSEPRTFPYDGYHGSYATLPFFAFAGLLAALCAARGIRLEVPVPMFWIVGGFSLLGLLFGGHSLLWAVPLCLFVAGSACGLLSRKRPNIAKFANPLLFMGACLACIGLADLLHEQFLTEIDLRGIASHLLGAAFPTILRSDSAPALSSVTDGNLSMIQIALDRMGGMHLVTLVLLTVTVSSWRGRGVKAIAVDLLGVFAYALVTGIYLLLTSTGEPERSWFVEENWVFAYAPLAVWLTLRTLTSKPTASSKATSKAASMAASVVPKWSWACVLAGLVMVGAGHSMWGPSRLKPGKVVLDDAHGDWETAQIPLDTKIFGRGSVYNYRVLSQELHRVYGAEVATHELSADELRNVSVLILRTPTKPFSAAFCDAVVDYVHRGGGLWMIGDHTDAFGMSTCMNMVAKRLDIEFMKNAWFEPPIKRNTWSPNAFTDPVAKDLTTFLFYTGCELATPWMDKRLMVARRNVLDEPDYSAGSFFGALRAIPNHDSGNVAMSTLGQREKGRVAAWSDSTLYSNFAIYTPGKLEIALNTVDWLRRENVFPMFRVLLMSAGLLLVGAGLVRLTPAAFLLSAFVVASTIPIMESTNRLSSPVWHQSDCLSGQTVAFFEPVKCPHLPIYMSLDIAGPVYYLSSFVSVQRVGGRPFVIEHLSDVGSANTMVAIPVVPLYSDEDIKGLAAWVAKGHNLIVLDGANDGGNLVSALYKAENRPSPLGIGYPRKTEDVTDSKGLFVGSVPAMPIERPANPVIMTKSDKTPLGGWYPFGAGRVFVTSTATLFSDQGLAYVQDTPTPVQFGMNKLIFSIFTDALGR